MRNKFFTRQLCALRQCAIAPDKFAGYEKGMVITMERKKAQITIQNIQHDISEEMTENIYAGFYTFHNGSHIVTYEEYANDEDARQSTQNLLKFTDSTVQITKKGLVHSKMIFTKGTCHKDFYQTPFGTFDMEIDTHDVHIKTGADSLHAELHYHLHLNRAPVSLCTIKIDIRF